ncbi:hypothetical protein F2P81_010339 [Scophthalmus maximus]|uniref:Uncharacterized protein n=1 Tax=Scophthalmus maximus TaxID=52904 RepID=A0A6A4SXI9_SCOMX|nr:hypothetical protein F2P81_010339 [Scophthalmus maximus]
MESHVQPPGMSLRSNVYSSAFLSRGTLHSDRTDHICTDTECFSGAAGLQHPTADVKSLDISKDFSLSGRTSTNERNFKRLYDIMSFFTLKPRAQGSLCLHVKASHWRFTTCGEPARAPESI